MAELLDESKRLAEAQPPGFQEALAFVTDSAVDPSIMELISIISNADGQVLATATRI
jgi:hypothetical protein